MRRPHPAMDASAARAEIKSRLLALANPETAITLQGFFKTSPGQYAEGDVFLGIKVPVIRALLKEYPHLGLTAAMELLDSEFHEQRLLALLLMVRSFAAGNSDIQQAVYQAYIASTAWINNWDLVDLSAPNIVGAHLFGRSRAPLYLMIRSSSLWERRIAIVATLHFIRQGEFIDTLQLATLLLNDREDLMHKSSGWMLREVGKRNQALLESFLCQHRLAMPRTMLRYAIERFPETLRRSYMQK